MQSACAQYTGQDMTYIVARGDKMEEKTIALCILGIVAVIALTGFVLLFGVVKTGQWWYAGGHVQYMPHEVCEIQDCILDQGDPSMIYPYANTDSGGAFVTCNCNGELRKEYLVQEYA